MASLKKIAANRINATHSTGPIDTSRTRFNGLAHGLTSKQTVVRGESQEEYDTFATELRAELKPDSVVEALLADRVIAAAWRLKRFSRVETSFFNSRIDAMLEADPHSDPDAALAALFTDPAEMARMRLFMRYQTATQREYDTAMRELRKEQAAHTTETHDDEPDADEMASTEAFIDKILQMREERIARENGFASQDTTDDESIDASTPGLAR